MFLYSLNTELVRHSDPLCIEIRATYNFFVDCHFYTITILRVGAGLLKTKVRQNFVSIIDVSVPINDFTAKMYKYN